MTAMNNRNQFYNANAASADDLRPSNDFFGQDAVSSFAPEEDFLQMCSEMFDEDDELTTIFRIDERSRNEIAELPASQAQQGIAAHGIAPQRIAPHDIALHQQMAGYPPTLPPLGANPFPFEQTVANTMHRPPVAPAGQWGSYQPSFAPAAIDVGLNPDLDVDFNDDAGLKKTSHKGRVLWVIAFGVLLAAASIYLVSEPNSVFYTVMSRIFPSDGASGSAATHLAVSHSNEALTGTQSTESLSRPTPLTTTLAATTQPSAHDAGGNNASGSNKAAASSPSTNTENRSAEMNDAESSETESRSSSRRRRRHDSDNSIDGDSYRSDNADVENDLSAAVSPSQDADAAPDGESEGSQNAPVVPPAAESAPIAPAPVESAAVTSLLGPATPSPAVNNSATQKPSNPGLAHLNRLVGPTPQKAIPFVPDKASIQRPLAQAAPQVQTCGIGVSGRVVIRVIISGATGRVVSSQVLDSLYQGTPIAQCVQRKVNALRFPVFQKNQLAIKYPYNL